MDERIQEGSFNGRERSFMVEKRQAKTRRAGVSAEKTMAAVKGKRSSSVVDMTTAPEGPPKSEEVRVLVLLLTLLLALYPGASQLRLLRLQVVAMLRRAVDSCLLFGGMTQAQPSPSPSPSPNPNPSPSPNPNPNPNPSPKQAQCDVVINTMLPHSFGAGDCMIEQGTSSSEPEP